MADPVRIPFEQIILDCSCGGYAGKKPGDTAGVAQHIRRSGCGGTWVARLPDDIVLEDDMDRAAAAGWGPDVGAARPGDGAVTLPPLPEDGPLPPPIGPAGYGQVAAGKVITAEPGGPTRFRGVATAPASLYAIYDAFRSQHGYGGTFDEWLVEIADLYCREVLGIELVVSVRMPEPAGARGAA